MQSRIKRIFANVSTEGGLLPSDLLQRILDAKDLPGLKAEDYGLTLGETLNESINRSWTRLQSLWATFQKQRAILPEADAGTTLTRRWLQVIFQELGYGQSLPNAEVIQIEDKPYPISHHWRQVPIHLVSFKADLDSRSAITGAKKASPHSLVQELLNRSDDHLWAFLSNGLRLRVLRDNATLTRQAFVEFDLETIFDSEAYADFRLLWLLCHQSRVEADQPEHCWLEKWTKEAQATGRRALEQLRQGVQQAVEVLGQGFIAHHANIALRDRLQSGILDKQDYYRQLLRLIYRLIFLFVAEDRDLLLDPKASPEARERYLKYYSGQRLRRLGERSRGTRHFDLYQGLRLVFNTLGCDEGCPPLAIPALGSFLFSPEALPDLQKAEIVNEALLDAMRRLTLTCDKQGLRLVDFRNLGSEELGSIYESLLELHPKVTTDPATFQLLTASGNERKTTGSYYTPDSLIQCLLDSALDPVLNEAAAKLTVKDAEAAILALKVCDPACGSGHFLIAAAHRIAKRLSSIRTGDETPPPDAQRSALRDVIGHCLYGVDLNPMAVELCKVNLWLEALEPGKPLSFLDAHIQCGNSLLGTTPELIAQGLPDEAFVQLEGDDKAVVSDLKKRNKRERQGAVKQKGTKTFTTPLFSGLATSYGPMIDGLSKEFEVLEAVEDGTLAAIHSKEARYKAMRTSEAWKHAKLVADAWCAAFVWEKTKARLNDEEGAMPITHDDIQRMIESPVLVSDGVRAEVERLSESYCFLHPHIAFPHVFQHSNGTGCWAGGFDLVLGNPPWETLEMKEEEWFAVRDPQIANAPNASLRKRMIETLVTENPELHAAYSRGLRVAQGERHVIRSMGTYPLCATGKINTYSIFSELMRRIVAPNGQVGVVVPSGIATDDTTKEFFKAISSSQTLVSLFSFENEEFLFPGVHHSTKFSLLTMTGPLRHNPVADFVCFARQVEDLKDPERHFLLSGEDLGLLNPNSGTCAVFRNNRDAQLTKAIYRRVPVLIREARGEEQEANPWELRFTQGLFNMASDSNLFRSEEDLLQDGWQHEGNQFTKGTDCHLPLFEAKMFHHFDHRFGTYEGQTEAQANQNKLPELAVQDHSDPNRVTKPKYWVSEREVKLRAADLPRSILKALENGQEEETLLALATWALGGTLLAAGASIPIANQMVESVWGHLCHSINIFLTIEAKDLDFLRGIEQSKEYPFTDSDRFILETRTTVQAAAEALLEARTPRWFMGWRDITLVTNIRTVIASLLPRAGVGHTSPLFRTRQDPALLTCLLANLSAFILDYVARQKIGGTHLTYGFLKQLPVLPPETYLQPAPWSPEVTIRDWMLPRVMELVYTAWDLRTFAQDCGYDGPPFIWDEERRFQIRCELDAAFFHLYGLTEEEVGYVMETFPVVKRKDKSTFEGFQTKEAILGWLSLQANLLSSP